MNTHTARKSPLHWFLAAATLVAVSLPLSAKAADGDVYVSGPTGVTQISLNGTKTLLPVVLLSPTGSVTDTSGNIYIADGATNSIVKIGPNGTQTTVATGLSDPQDLALDVAGNLFVANAGTDSILKIDPDGMKTTFATGLNGPQGLAFDSAGNLFASNADNNTVVKIAPDGMKTTVISTGLNSPGGLAFDAIGHLLVADSGSDSIIRLNPDGTTTTVVSAGLSDPQDVAVDALGNLLVSDAGSNSVLKVAPDGTISTLGSGIIQPRYLTQASSLHQLLNLSTRGFVEPGDHALIGGFIVQGTPSGDVGQTTIIVRAIGPSLPEVISDRLLNPKIDLYDSTGALVASNDDWKDSQQAQIEASGLAPEDDRESAIEATLADGSYTAIVTGVGSTSGVALVEAYKIQ